MAYASKTMVTAFASAIAALLTTQSATAVTPTAVWDCAVAGQKLNTTQGGLTIKANYGVTVSDKITISSNAYGGAYIELPSDLSKVSVLVKYSNFSGFTDYQYYGGNSLFAPQFMAVYDSKSRTAGLRGLNSANNFQWYAITTYISTVGGPAFPAASGYALFAYNNAQGMYLATGTSVSNMTGSEKTDSGYYFNDDGTISKLGLGGSPDGEYGVGWPGLIIEKVALFTGEYYTASDVESYKFPSEIYKSDVTVSTINTDYPDETEIDVYLADGVTVTGDTNFNASTVHFVCDGSFNMAPPANNKAVFDFSDVAGQPRIVYDGVLPTVVGTTFTSNTVPTFVTDSTQWTGTIWLKNTSITALDSNSYGNNESTLKFTNVTGYFAQNHVNTVPIELDGDGFYYDNGWGGELQTFSELKGSGMFKTGNAGNGGTIWVKKYSDFSGAMTLAYKKVVLGGSEPIHPNTNWGGQLVIADDSQIATVASGKTWGISSSVTIEGTLAVNGFIWASGGITVNGEIKAASLSNFGGGTYITTSDTGVFTLIDSSNTQDQDADYARITGTGTLRYADVSGKWRSLSAVNFPTNMICENNLSSGLILTTIGENTIGSLAGDGYLRSDWGGSAGDRDLRVLQATNTTWSGKFWTANEHRLRSLIVAPGTTTSGTLTISATHEAAESTGLTVESGAAVNLTGTWVGATTVVGTLGGTGAITGDLTLSDGATLKVGDMSDALAVSGSLTATGAITIDLPEEATPGMIIDTGSRPDIAGATFTVVVGGEPSPKLRVVAKKQGLKVTPPSTVIILR